jgi:hypothetical protein
MLGENGDNSNSDERSWGVQPCLIVQSQSQNIWYLDVQVLAMRSETYFAHYRSKDYIP